jgi:hypothetical protein
MTQVADSALLTLLKRAESRHIRRGSGRVTLSMGPRTFPAYTAIKSFDEKESVHAILLDAQRRGALQIEWDRAAGQQNQVKRLILDDPDALAAVMRCTPAWEHLRLAEESLVGCASEFPTVDRFLTAWREGRAPRSIGAANVGQVEDAIAVLRYINNHPGTDFSLRTVSVLLFGDSKRLERLRSPLDVLTASEPTIPRHRDEVFGELGLLRAPQPMLMAGPGNLITTGGCIPLIEPYVGLAPSSVVGLGREAIRYVLTIENLTPFYELARRSAGALQGLIIYTGGTPSPAWRKAYERLVSATPPTCPLFHWGDIDPGGLRIAFSLAQVLAPLGRHLRPHLMDPASLAVVGTLGREALAPQVGEMASIARRLGWHDLADSVESSRVLIEQEGTAAALPEDSPDESADAGRSVGLSSARP